MVAASYEAPLSVDISECSKPSGSRLSLTFIVRIAATRIKEDRLSGHHIDMRIAMANVAMDQGWLDMSPSSFKGPQESRDDLVKELIGDLFKARIQAAHMMFPLDV